MTFRSSLGLGFRGLTRWGSSVTVVALGPFFRFGFGNDFFGFRVDFGRILGAQNGPKIDFWSVFFDVFFENGFGIDLESIFEGSKP